MRYKVRAASDHAFTALLSLLQAEHVHVYTTSPRRRFVSTGNLSEKVRRQVASQGGSVSEDRQYGLDHR